MKSDLELDLPGGPGLPPPPPMDRDAFIEFWLLRMADFYKSAYYEAWLRRTSDEMRDAEPFILD